MSIIDDIGAVLEIGKDVLSGKKSVHQLGEEILGDGTAQKSGCAKSKTCVLGDAHEGECKPVKAVKSIDEMVDIP